MIRGMQLTEIQIADTPTTAPTASCWREHNGIVVVVVADVIVVVVLIRGCVQRECICKQSVCIQCV